jgi:hypothetical protein
LLSKTNMTEGEIAQRFASMMSQPAISKHLSVLGACLSNRQILLVKEARVRFCLWA